MALGALAAIAVAGWSQTVGFTPGLDGPLPWQKLDSSTVDLVAVDVYVVLSEAMDLLYEEGYIVTDDVVVFLTKEGFRDPSYGVKNANAGGIDILVLARFVFVPSPVEGGGPVLQEIQYRIVRVADGKVLFESTIEDCIPAEINAASLKTALVAAGKEIGAKCIETTAGR